MIRVASAAAATSGGPAAARAAVANGEPAMPVAAPMATAHDAIVHRKEG